jgi:hypothetical protein
VASQNNLYFISFRTEKIIDPYNDLSDLNITVYPTSKSTKVLAIDELAILHNSEGFSELRQGADNITIDLRSDFTSRISGKTLSSMKLDLMKCLEEKQSYSNSQDFQQFMELYNKNSQELYKMYTLI